MPAAPSPVPWIAAIGRGNFPICGTTIPLNTMQQTVDGQDSLWWSGCGFKSRHPGGATFDYCDGSVHFLSQSIDYKLYNQMGSRAGGEVVTVP